MTQNRNIHYLDYDMTGLKIGSIFQKSTKNEFWSKPLHILNIVKYFWPGCIRVTDNCMICNISQQA